MNIELGDYSEEIHAAYAYNVAARILEGLNAELNDLPWIPDSTKRSIARKVIRKLVANNILEAYSDEIVEAVL